MLLSSKQDHPLALVILPTQTPIRCYSTTPDKKKDPNSESKETPSLLHKTGSWLKTLPGKIKEELIHYWTGTKLLGYEISICFSLLRKITKGHSLSRRERRQLTRTAGDLLRLVPFAIFVIVPFMEFLLPIFLKIFPNMLPSTFHSSLKKEEARKKELKAKIQVAKFLQEVLYNRAKDLTAQDDAEKFKEFLERVRNGVEVENEDILRFASLLEDEFTLDQLSREQLVAMSQYMQLPTFGTNSFLRYNLNKKVLQLKADDKMIEAEGVDSLTLSELQQACAARGLKATSRSKLYLRERLREWLDLSLKQNLSVALLILANAFKITSTTATKDDLRDAIYHLSPTVIDTIRLKVASNDPSLKLELLKDEEAKIKDQNAEERVTEERIKRSELVEWMSKEKDIAQSSVEFSASQLKMMTEAVAALADSSSVETEQKQLKELKELLERRKKEIEKLTVKDVSGEPQPEMIDEKEKNKKRERAAKEISAANRLSSWVEELAKSTEKETALGIQHMLGLDWDKDRDGKVDLEELKQAAKFYKEHLPDELVEHVVKRLDADNDGKISLHELQQLAAKYATDNHEKL